MRIVALVPVKMNNERFPNKNIKRFPDGTPLITFFLKMLLKVKEIDEYYVFCSDESITAYFPDKRIVFLKRPEYLDMKDATPQAIIEEFMSKVDADIYTVCHCTSPFVHPDKISTCIKKVSSHEFDSALTAQRVQKLMWHDGKPLNFDPTNIPRTQDLPVFYSELSAAYVFSKNTFLKYRRRTGNHPYICEVSGYEGIDIDYVEDFQIAEAIYTSFFITKTNENSSIA